MLVLKITKKNNKCISNTRILQTLVQLKLCATLRPLFKSNISVADCIPLSSLLKAIKTNGGVECRCV